MRRIPKHVPAGIYQDFYNLTPINYGPKPKTHSAEKYSSRAYSIGKTRLNIGNTRTQRTSTEGYQYEYHMMNVFQFTKKDYQNLLEILARYFPGSGEEKATPKQRLSKTFYDKRQGEKKATQCPSYRSTVYGKKGALTHSLVAEPEVEDDKKSPLIDSHPSGNKLVDIDFLRKLKAALSEPLNTSIYQDSLIKKIIEENELELRKIFSLTDNQVPDAFSSETFSEEAPNLSMEEKMRMSRKKWNTLQKKSLFEFSVDIINNTTNLRRKLQYPGMLEKECKVTHRKIAGEDSTLSPHLQKSRFGKWVISSLPSISKSVDPNILKGKVMDIPKFYSKIKKFLQEGMMEMPVNLTKSNFETLDKNDLLQLYSKLKSVIYPSIQSTPYPALASLDPEIAEIAKSLPATEAGLTPFDRQLLSKYQYYLSQVETGEIYSGFWLVKKTIGAKPTCRECSNTVNIGERIYLFGGYGFDRFNDLWCSSEVSDIQWNWTQINPIGRQIPDKRYGHCMATYRNKIYVHAGGGEYVPGLRVRATLNDTWSYSIEDNIWTRIEDANKGTLRRISAASALLDGLWIIHGGYDGSRSVIHSDLAAFDFNTEQFVNLFLPNNSKPGKKIGPLSMHSAVSVLPSTVSNRAENIGYWNNFHKWKIPPNEKIARSRIGVYILGGMVNDSEYNRNVYILRANSTKTMEINELATLKGQTIGPAKFVVDIEKLSLSGPPPKPRALQTAIFIDKYIAVFGGRNDVNCGDAESHCLNDLCLLDVEVQEWKPVVVYGFVPSPRWGHTMGQFNNKIVIIGGVSDSKYCPLNISILETDKIKIYTNLNECQTLKRTLESEARRKKIL